MNVAAILERRRVLREERLALARRFADQLPVELGVLAVVVFGSVARGDCNAWSDTDVLVVARHLPVRPLDRPLAAGPSTAGVQPVLWLPEEWRRQQRRGNPIAVEAVRDGVWLVGDAAALA